MRALVYHGPGQKAWEEVPKPQDHRRHRRDRPRRRGHDLRHRPAHPQRRRARGDRRTDPRPRGRRHRRVGRHRGQDRQGRRPRARLVHHRVRHVPVLPRRPLRPVPGRRRLDPRPHDRRHPGRVRPRAVRRHSTYPVPAGVTDEEILMLADILPTGYEVGVLNGGVAARRRRRRRRRRPDRPGRDHGRAAVQPEPHRRHRPGRQPAGGGQAVRRGRHGQQRQPGPAQRGPAR